MGRSYSCRKLLDNYPKTVAVFAFMGTGLGCGYARRRRRLLLVSCAAGLLFQAACGGGSSGSKAVN